MDAHERLGGRFALEREVGRGAMGVVFLARDERADVPAAVKVMRPNLARGAARFAQEVAVLRALEHPGIVRLLGEGVTADGLPWFAMEWLEGETLEARLRRGRLELRETRALAWSLCAALEHAHSRGVVHRDLKPANVLLVAGDPCRPKLLDFGVARRDGGDEGLPRREGDVVGTPGYLAPEQAAGRTDVDARADLFALGCVIYECLTGRPAFVAAHPIALLARVCLAGVTPLSVLAPHTPAPLVALCTSLLQKDPAARLASANAAAAVLAEVDPEVPPAPLVGAVDVPAHDDELRPVAVVLCAAGAPHADPALDEAVGAAARRIEAAAHPLAGGAVAVRIRHRGEGAVDLATRAVDCALDVRARRPDATAAVAFGRASQQTDAGIGDVIERAAQLLVAPLAPRGSVRLDVASAGLLADRYALARHGEITLARGRVDGDPRDPSPCVGRDRELAALMEVWREAAEDRASAAAVVVGGPGDGTSRLCRELIVRVRHQAPDALVLHGVVDATRAPASLASLLGVPAPQPEADTSPAGRAQAEHAAVEAFVATSCARGPVLVAIDGLQRADPAAVATLDRLLRACARSPLVVVAFARPEVDARFPRLWAVHGVTRLALRALPPAASEQLLRAAAGPDVDAGWVAAALRRAEGNPSLLVELGRAAREGRAGGVPPSLEALVAARFDALDDEARRLLRAASVYGERFALEGACALLSPAPDAAALAQAMDGLTRREVIVARATPRLAATREFAFRGAMLRDAAYASLADDTRRALHRSAAAWLEGAGELDAPTLAAHWTAADEPDRAARWLLRGAQAAVAAADLDGASTLLARGLALAREPELRAALLEKRFDVEMSSGRPREALDTAREAFTAAPPATAVFYRVAGRALSASAAIGDFEAFDAVARRARSAPPARAAREAYLAYGALSAAMFFQAGDAASLGVLEAELERFLAADVALMPDEALAMYEARAVFAFQRGDLSYAYHCTTEVARTHATLGRDLERLVAQVNLSWLLLALGRADDALRIARDTEAGFARHRRWFPVARVVLAACLQASASPAEALAVLDELVARAAASRDLRALAYARLHRADALLALGRHDEALADTAEAHERGMAARLPHVQGGALALTAEARRALGDDEGAYVLAARAMELTASMERLESFESRMAWTLLALTRARLGDDQARVVAAAVAGRVRRFAGMIYDDALRASFLSLDEHAAILGCAAELGV